MIFFIIGVLAALVALAVLLLSEEGKAAAFIPGVVAVILIGVSCVSYVPTGYTGIVTTFGKVEDGTKDAGVVFKSPWQSIVKMDNRVQEMNMDLSAFSSDIQEVATSVAVGYRINQQNAMTIYKSVGKKYEDTLITPRVQETVKAVVAHYDASSLISNRDAVASQMDTKLREVLAEYRVSFCGSSRRCAGGMGSGRFRSVRPVKVSGGVQSSVSSQSWQYSASITLSSLKSSGVPLASTTRSIRSKIRKSVSPSTRKYQSSPSSASLHQTSIWFSLVAVMPFTMAGAIYRPKGPTL